VPLEPFNQERALRVGEQARLRVAARSKTGCALELDYGSLRVLLPGEAGPADLPAELFQDPGLVVLAPPEGWEESGLRQLSPPPGGWVELTTDGEKLWVEEGRR